MCLSNHSSFACFACFSLLWSTSLSVSLEIRAISVFLVIFYSSSVSINMFWQSCSVLLNFFLSFDFKDASFLISASANVWKVPELSKKFNLRNSIMFIFSLSLEEYFFIFKTFPCLWIGIGFCKDGSLSLQSFCLICSFSHCFVWSLSVIE